MTVLTTHEQQEIDRANTQGKQPVVFVHGLWLLASSWERWRGLFEEQGYTTLAPGWPDDPDTVEEAKQDPEVFAHKRIKQVTHHYVDAIHQLKRKPLVIGHSFGGLLAQMVAGEGVTAVTVAIDPAPFRGVLPVPPSALRAAVPVLRNPANRRRAVMLTYPQWRYAFANTSGEDEARELYATFAVPAPGAPIFEAAFANLNPRTDVRVDVGRADRGPLLIVEGEKDNTVPWAIANAAFKLQRRNPAPTAIERIGGRGHGLVIDAGWRDVATVALEFAKKSL